MAKENNKQLYLCSSAEWEIVAEATSPEGAASIALQIQIDQQQEQFSVGPVISVIPIKLLKNKGSLVYTPAALADIGMYNYAEDLIKHLDK